MCLTINIRILFSMYKNEEWRSQYWKANEEAIEEEFIGIKPKKKAITN